MLKPFLFCQLCNMKNVWCLVLLLVAGIVNAQSYNDLGLLYSRSGISGTARSVGSASAYGSVGADLGSISINPAGLGLYRSTDISFTPGLFINKNKADFDGTTTVGNNTKVFINQFGIAFTKLIKHENRGNNFSFNAVKLNAISFSINYQRESMYSKTVDWSSDNTQSSAMGYFANAVNKTGMPLNTDNYPVEMVLAYQTYLLDSINGNGNFYSNVRAPIHQSGNILTKGATDHVDLALGGNLNDKFYFGAGIGFSVLTYMQDASFSESKTNDTANHFMDYTFTSNLRNTGLGVVGKFGIIYRPASWIRLGLAYHTPTFYNITETYSGSTVANFDTATFGQTLEAYPFKYKLKTPMKGIASTSFYFKEYGFLSVDYEFQNYGAMRFSFPAAFGNATSQSNDFQKKYYAFGHVVRAGFEGSYKVLRVRAGYAYSSTPYKKAYVTKNYTEEKHTVSAGLGYRGKHFYVDFAYQLGITKEPTYPYADWEVNNKLLSHTALLTIGFRIFKNTPEQTDSKSRSAKPGMKF